VVLEENPAIVKVANSWIIMNPGGGPTPDIASFHREATAKGAQFLTEPLDRKAELRCYLRDPDGYLVEVEQATGMLEGVFADPPAGNQR
jgi:hypothetical protein